MGHGGKKNKRSEAPGEEELEVTGEELGRLELVSRGGTEAEGWAGLTAEASQLV